MEPLYHTHNRPVGTPQIYQRKIKSLQVNAMDLYNEERIITAQIQKQFKDKLKGAYQRDAIYKEFLIKGKPEKLRSYMY